MASPHNPNPSPTTKTPKIQVLCLGMCRTGTQSLADALQLLNYGLIYHMREVGKNKHHAIWLRALEAKFAGKGEELSKEEWDGLVGGYGGVTDIPASLFIPELMDAYPSANIILSVRDEDSWLKSMKSTLFHAKPSPFAEKLYAFIWGDDEQRTDERIKEMVRVHNETVREEARKRGREVLEWRVEEGWEKLCEFLWREVPMREDGDGVRVAVEFPRSDDWKEYKKEHGL